MPHTPSQLARHVPTLREAVAEILAKPKPEPVHHLRSALRRVLAELRLLPASLKLKSRQPASSASPSPSSKPPVGSATSTSILACSKNYRKNSNPRSILSLAISTKGAAARLPAFESSSVRTMKSCSMSSRHCRPPARSKSRLPRPRPSHLPELLLAAPLAVPPRPSIPTRPINSTSFAKLPRRALSC